MESEYRALMYDIPLCCHNSIFWSPLVNWMLQYYLQQLGAAREGDGEGLAVSDVDESDTDARGWKTCRMNQMLMQD